MKDAILKTMEAIINEELDNSNCRLEDVTYKNQRTLINTLFVSTGMSTTKGLYFYD